MSIGLRKANTRLSPEVNQVLYVRKFPFNITNEEMYEIFRMYGAIRQICETYSEDQLLKNKIELLSKTNMVDNSMDIHKSLYHTDDVPQDMVDRRVEVVARLKSLEEGLLDIRSVTKFSGKL